ALVPLVAEAVHHVRAVAVELDGAPLGEGAEALERSHELHAVVGGGRLAAGELDLDAVGDENGRPAAGAGSTAAGAGAVDVDGHVGPGAVHGSPSPCPLPGGEREMPLIISALALSLEASVSARTAALSPEGRGDEGALPVRGETIGYGSQ